MPQLSVAARCACSIACPSVRLAAAVNDRHSLDHISCQCLGVVGDVPVAAAVAVALSQSMQQGLYIHEAGHAGVHTARALLALPPPWGLTLQVMTLSTSYPACCMPEVRVVVPAATRPLEHSTSAARHVAAAHLQFCSLCLGHQQAAPGLGHAAAEVVAKDVPVSARGPSRGSDKASRARCILEQLTRGRHAFALTQAVEHRDCFQDQHTKLPVLASKPITIHHIAIHQA